MVDRTIVGEGLLYLFTWFLPWAYANQNIRQYINIVIPASELTENLQSFILPIK